MRITGQGLFYADLGETDALSSAPWLKERGHSWAGILVQGGDATGYQQRAYSPNGEDDKFLQWLVAAKTPGLKIWAVHEYSGGDPVKEATMLASRVPLDYCNKSTFGGFITVFRDNLVTRNRNVWGVQQYYKTLKSLVPGIALGLLDLTFKESPKDILTEAGKNVDFVMALCTWSPETTAPWSSAQAQWRKWNSWGIIPVTPFVPVVGVNDMPYRNYKFNQFKIESFWQSLDITKDLYAGGMWIGTPMFDEDKGAGIFTDGVPYNIDNLRFTPRIINEEPAPVIPDPVVPEPVMPPTPVDMSGYIKKEQVVQILRDVSKVINDIADKWWNMP